MGVSGLRALLEDCVFIDNLPAMAWEHWETHRTMLRVGIDSSIWLVSVDLISKAHDKVDPLKVLLYKLFRLYSAPILPVFVFDGPLRPKLKRGKEINTAAPIVNERKFREMAASLGFECWSAPGEAEAELSYLASIQMLDVVITDDSDAMLFGAPVVLSKPNRGRRDKKLGPDDYKVYRLVDIKEQYEVDCKGLILVGLMGGADYDTVGIEKCRVSLALAVAKYGFGNTLIDGYERHTEEYFTKTFLPAWRKQIVSVFRNNTNGILGEYRQLKIARSITDDFPDLQVLELHIKPVTSKRHGETWTGVYEKNDLRVAEASAYAEKIFGWRNGILLEKLRRNLWLGATVRSLVMEVDSPGLWNSGCASLKLNNTEPRSSTSASRVTDHFGTNKAVQGKGKGRPPPQRRTSSSSDDSNSDEESDVEHLVPFQTRYPFLTKITLVRERDERKEYRVAVDATRFATEALNGLNIPVNRVKTTDSSTGEEHHEAEDLEDDGEEEESDGGAPISNVEDPFRPFRVWLPAIIVEQTYPHLVQGFQEKQARSEATKNKSKEDRPEDPVVAGMRSGLSSWLSKSDLKTVDVVELSSSQSTFSEGSDLVYLSPSRNANASSSKRAYTPGDPIEISASSSPVRPTPSKMSRVSHALGLASDPLAEDDISYADVDLSWLPTQDVKEEKADPFDCDWIPLTVSQEANLLGT